MRAHALCTSIKRRAWPGYDEEKFTYDGEGFAWTSTVDDFDLTQSQNRARWLGDWLKKSYQPRNRCSSAFALASFSCHSRTAVESCKRNRSTNRAREMAPLETLRNLA